ncbi:MAG: class I SAM-dependent methyltransferase [Alphaproteobacteria bacterium]
MTTMAKGMCNEAVSAKAVDMARERDDDRANERPSSAVQMDGTLTIPDLFDLACLDPEILPRATGRQIKALRGLSFSMKAALRIALNLEWGTLIVALPAGEVLRFAGTLEPGAVAAIRIHDQAMAARLLTGGNIGVADAYLDGQWDTPDLTALLDLVSRNGMHMRAFIDARPLVRLAQRAAHSLNRNTKSQSRKNIEAHYDLGNDFYETWLDRTMTYSSAVFDHPAQDLARAQETKYTALLSRLGVTADHHVLEIGCGWGGFAVHAARTTGARVTGVTISKAQHDYAQRRVFEAGLADRVTIAYRDYRDVSGQFDRIASIEMFEAVGEQYWPTFFGKIQSVLTEDGLAGLQIISIRDDLYADYRTSQDFIQKYIFPGGMLPSPTILDKQLIRAGLTCADKHLFGLDYARTLAQWRRRFLEAWPAIAAQGFDERFKRMWLYYYAYCEAGFRSTATDVGQYVLKRA